MIGDTPIGITPPRLTPTWRFNLGTVRYAPLPFAIYTVFTIIYLGGRFVPGLIEKRVFDTITGASPATFSLVTLIALFASAELGRLGSTFGSVWGTATYHNRAAGIVRGNLLRRILSRPGAVPLLVSSGEAISRFGYDVDEVCDFPTWIPDVVGNVLATVVAIIIMARINLTITLVIFAPLIGALLLARFAWWKMLRLREVDRAASGAVAGFLGEILGAVQAVKVASGEDDVIARFQKLNERRRAIMLRVRLFWSLLDSIRGTAVTFGVGVTILLAAEALAAKTFTVGDFALFVYYLWFTTDLPGYLGTFLGDYRTQQVSIGRLEELIQPAPIGALVAPVLPRTTGARAGDSSPNPMGAAEVLVSPLLAGEGYSPQSQPRPNSRDSDSKEGQPLTLTLSRGERGFVGRHCTVERDDIPRTLVVRGLTYTYPRASNGIRDISFSLPRGSLTVITGRIGSGKTTLLRALTGLLPMDRGVIVWNDAVVRDPATFFQPPRCAYVAQVPRLFSESLRDNVLMGLTENQIDLNRAIWLSVLESDVDALDKGLDTVVGPRGVRLSGGQVQRAAAARAFVRAPDLLVLDDLSSALDVETERALWDRLDAPLGDEDESRPTVLAVSHRRVALRKADHVIVLDGGAVVAAGSLDDVLETSVELQRIWHGEEK